MRCTACPRHCPADRITRKGFCGTTGLNIARVGLHLWEEPCISGRNGSGTIFFTGCNLRCRFCQNEAISRGACGRDISPDTLGRLMLYLQDLGAENINLVSPTHFSEPIAETLQRYKPRLHIPVVYNSNGYESVEHLRRLEGLVDVYLPDFKYADDDLALTWSEAGRYFETAAACVTEMFRQMPRNIFRHGLLKKGLLVRHLVLPGQLTNSKRVIDFLAQLSPDIYISLMAQYFPTAAVRGDACLGRRLTQAEYDEVCDYLFSKNMENGYLQELESNSEAYVPDFGLEALDRVLAQLQTTPLS